MKTKLIALFIAGAAIVGAADVPQQKTYENTTTAKVYGAIIQAVALTQLGSTVENGCVVQFARTYAKPYPLGGPPRLLPQKWVARCVQDGNDVVVHMSGAATETVFGGIRQANIDYFLAPKKHGGVADDIRVFLTGFWQQLV